MKQLYIKMQVEYNLFDLINILYFYYFLSFLKSYIQYKHCVFFFTYYVRQGNNLTIFKFNTTAYSDIYVLKLYQSYCVIFVTFFFQNFNTIYEYNYKCI